MRDNEIIAVIRSTILTGFSDRNLFNVEVQQADQPILEGANSPPTIYLTKISGHRYGFLKRSSRWDAELDKEIHEETQYWEDRYQFNALVSQPAYSIIGYTASDVLNIVSDVLQSDKGRAQLWESEIGIQRITDVRNPYFKNDKDQSQASPSFDAIFSYKNTRIIDQNTVTKYQSGIHGV